MKMEMSISETRGDIKYTLTKFKGKGYIYYKDRMVEGKPHAIFALESSDGDPDVLNSRMVFHEDGRGTLFLLDQ